MVDGYRRFSTLGLSGSERIEKWEKHNAEALVGLAAHAIDGAPLEATEVNLQLPRLQFAHVSANPHVVERTADHIARGETDRIALYFSLKGDAFFYQRDVVRLQQPGTLLICDVDQPFLRGFANGLQEYVLVVPREVFEATTDGKVPAQPLVLHFADVPGGDVHAAALARLVERSLGDPGTASHAATEESALDLLRTMFSPDAAHSTAAYRRTALDWIERHLSDPTISVSRVAQAVGVSERHLARAFGETGSGVARTILERRLEHARRLLSSPGAPAVRDAAYSSGFVSHAHFSRVFRERYDMTPG
ncbi:MAG: helix-turn-helix transcriptional regulator, partial [Microbacteriaceae bacterium]|nr:helix-turn-helix transcriptional regulator [Microbacteriaceae bacterium]